MLAVLVLTVLALLASPVLSERRTKFGFPQGPRSDPSPDFTPFDPAYKLVWSDEFNQPDGSEPDPKVWNIEVSGNGQGNQELEYYTARRNNSFIHDGRLVIQGLAEHYMGHNYTSARINTQGKKSFYLGYIAFRARLMPHAIRGSWPALWMLGEKINTIGWPRSGEIDIMEQVNGDGTGTGGSSIADDSVQFGTLHFSVNGVNDTNAVHNSTGATIKEKKGKYWGDEYHVYSGLWTEKSFTFLVDDLAYESIDLTALKGYNSFTDPSNPFFLICNLALGGQFPHNAPSPKEMPIQFHIDWVRVFQTAAMTNASSVAVAPHHAEPERITHRDGPQNSQMQRYASVQSN